MAMFNKNQQGVKLSPENYIRQRARTLPIYECLVNKGWEESKMADVVVARLHVNGNVTLGLYQVDLYCLGVKDTFYAFNIPIHEYRDKFTPSNGEFELEFDKIDYNLAHNIIFAGVDFATEIGFDPHKDFLKTTQYLLEEDDENIELVEVECGYNGQPAVVRGEENSKECSKIIAKLDYLVGKGNYHVFDVDGFDEEEPEEEAAEYTQEQFEKDKKTFKKGVKKLDRMKYGDFINFMEVSRQMFYHLVDNTKVDEAYNNIIEALDVEVFYDDIPDEFFGITTSTINDMDWLKRRMIDAFYAKADDENALTLYNSLKDAYPDMPAVAVLDLHFLSQSNFEIYQQRLAEYRAKFTEYKFFDIINYLEVSESKPLNEELLKKELRVCDFFDDRKKLFWVEMYYFIRLYSVHTLSQANPIRIGALYDFLFEEYLPQEATAAGKITSLIFMTDYVEKSV
jgi:hypothetical protein